MNETELKKIKIAKDLAKTKKDFEKLVTSINPQDWERVGKGTVWNVRELCFHIGFGTERIINNLNGTRKGKGFNPPQKIREWLNVLLTKRGARGMTKKLVLEYYEKVYKKMLNGLRTIKEEEWGISAQNFGQMQTVEELFLATNAHFKEHQAQIKKIIDA